MRITGSTSLTGPVQKWVETANGYIVNGHYYYKDTLSVVPFKVFPTMSHINDISMSRKLVLNHTYTHHAKTSGDTIVIDRYDTTLTYIITTNIRNNDLLILKLKEDTTGNVSLVNSVDLGASPTTNPLVRCYCGQDDKFVYYIISCASFHDYFVKIDKISLAMTVLEDIGTYSWSSFIKETSTYIYYGRKQGYGTCVVKRYNKLTALTDTLTTSAKTTNIYYSTCYSHPSITISDSEMYIFSLFHNQTTNKYGITRYKIDTTQSSLTNILTEADMAITWGTTTTQFPVFASNGNVHYEPFITTADNGNMYLNIAIYEIQNSSTTANLPGYGIYTFLIDMTNNALIFKNLFQPTTSDYIRGFIGSRNNTFLVCATTPSCMYCNFNSSTESFQLTGTLGNQPYHIGVDQSENIFILDSLTQVEIIGPTIPVNVNIKSELDKYPYNNADISSYITVSCQSPKGDYIASNLQLSIAKGSAIFTSTGNKTITITTLTTGDMQIPIKVQGGTPIVIQSSFIM